MGFAFSIGHGAVGGSRLRKTLLRHFGVSPGEIATAGRQFPITARVDIQSALEDLFKPRTGTKLLGILSPNQHEVPALANTLAGAYFPIDAGPLQRDEIDVGEAIPVRCLKNGLWLSRDKDLPFAIMMAPGGRFGLRTGVHGQDIYDSLFGFAIEKPYDLTRDGRASRAARGVFPASAFSAAVHDGH